MAGGYVSPDLIQDKNVLKITFGNAVTLTFDVDLKKSIRSGHFHYQRVHCL